MRINTYRDDLLMVPAESNVRISGTTNVESGTQLLFEIRSEPGGENPLFDRFGAIVEGEEDGPNTWSFLTRRAFTRDSLKNTEFSVSARLRRGGEELLQVDGENRSMPGIISPDTTVESLVINDQEISEGDSQVVVIDEVELDRKGLIAIERDGSRIGTSWDLRAGVTHSGIPVELDRVLPEDVEVEAVAYANPRLDLPFNNGDVRQSATLYVGEHEPAYFDVSELVPVAVTVAAAGVDPAGLSFSALVTNTGEAEATQTIELSVEGSVVNRQDVTLAGEERLEVAFTIETSVLSDLTPGNYTYTVSSDDDSVEGSLTIPQPATFEITSYAPEEATVTSGDEVIATATIENTGDLDGTQAAVLSFDSDAVDDIESQITLDGGASESVEFTFTTPDVDDGETLTHTISTSDDEVTGELRIQNPDPANFEVTAFSLDEGTVTEDETLTASATVQNTGGVEGTQIIVLAVGDDATYVEELTLFGGESQSVEFEYTAPDVDETAPITHTLSTDDDAVNEVLTIQQAEDEPARTAGTTEQPSTGSETSTDNGGPPLSTETLLAVGGGSVGTLLGAYGLLRRRFSDDPTTLASANSANTDEPSANTGEAAEASSTADTPSDSEEDPPASAEQTADPVAPSSQTQTVPLEQAVPELESLMKVTRSQGLVTYRGRHAGAESRALVYALAPDAADEQSREVFTQTVRGWYNGHTHPNVVTIHDRGTEPTPWVAVDPLKDRRSVETLSNEAVETVVSVLTDAAEALRNVGLYNTSHQNLMPAHVWIDQTEEGMRGVVGDWGLRRSIREAQGEMYVTPYTAPEQLSGTSHGLDAVDVYGLGAVSYYALTGQAPLPATEEAILAGESDPPSEVSDVSESFDIPVMQALATDPAERFDSVYAFAQALERAREDD